MALNYLYFTNKAFLTENKPLEITFHHMIDTYYPNTKQSSRTKMIQICFNIVFNCARVKEHKSKYLTLMLGNNFFSAPITINGKECRLPYGRVIFTKTLDMFVEDGLINIKVGGNHPKTTRIDSKGNSYDFYDYDVRESSKMIPTDNMLDLVKSTSVDTDLNNTSMIILRVEEKKDKSFSMTTDLRRQKKVLLGYNEILKDHVFSDKEGVVIDDPLVRRIYSKDFKHNGRFYVDRGLIQTMHQQDRKLIRIDGSPVNEIDVKSMHMAIAYTLEGCKMQKDPYDFPISCSVDKEAIEYFKKVTNQPNYNPFRNFCKLLCLCAFTVSSEDTLCCTMSKKIGVDKLLHKENDIEKLRESQFYGLSFFKVSEAITTMKETHSDILMRLFNRSGCMQFMDAQFMNRVLTYGVQCNKVVIPVHDSVICKVEDTEELLTIMTKSFAEVYGNSDNLTLCVK